MLGTISHLVISTRDLDRSVAFYEKLGFTNFFEFETDSTITGEVLASDVKRVRMAFLRPDEAKDATYLDIVEFIDPPTLSDSTGAPTRQGVTRIAFGVEDLDATYERLREMGVEFLSPIVRYPGPDGGEEGMVCFRDPDGIILEIISPRPGFHSSTANVAEP